MPIFVLKNDQQTGPIADEEIISGLQSGAYHYDDLAWREGLKEWQPLSCFYPPPPPQPRVESAVQRTAVTTQSQQTPAIATAAPRQVSYVAIASLTLALLAFFATTFTIGLPAIPAVICGHIALSRIKRSSGRLGGRGFAFAGLVMGYIVIALMIIAFPIFWAVYKRGRG